MICEKVRQILEQQSPEHLACEWDNVGLLIGSRKKEIKKIYIALDATEDVITEAIAHGADMLITHHPLIFSGIKQVLEEDFIGRRVIKLVKADIAYYAMHTNFDVMGMAQLAEERMGLKNATILEVAYVEAGRPEGIGRVGMLSHPMKLRDCALEVKRAFDIENVRIYGDLDKKITHAAISPGSGKGAIQEAIKAGAGVLITGDIGHHDGIDAVAQGLAIIDAGHYGLEHIFIAYMENYILKNTNGMEVFTKEHIAPFVVV